MMHSTSSEILVLRLKNLFEEARLLDVDDIFVQTDHEQKLFDAVKEEVKR